jgi:S-adenosylmethionine:tRNA-ribosyltransferase-isomerase (queuine synthetase)
MFSFKLTKKNGNLVHINETTKISYQLFLDKLQEGQEVEVFMGLTSDNGSLAQLAKIHACIRELAKESGYTFDEMKFIVKKHSGLCYDGGGAEYCKSFKECSKDELAMAIESAIEIGRDLNINLA